MKIDMRKYNTILFDLDGTVLDTSEGILRSIEETIALCQLPELSAQVKRSMIGPPVNQSLKKIYGLTDARTNEVTALFRKLYSEKYLMEMKAYPGILELLAQLRQSGYKVGIATYKRDDYAQRLMNGAGINALCHFTLGSDGKEQTKAEIIQICLNALQCRHSRECIMIGDTIHDLEGAKNAGTAFIGVTYGFGFRSKAEILALNAAGAADSAEEILAEIRRLC